MRILHLAPESSWRQAMSTGSYRGSTRGADLSQVGYVHASTGQQLPSVIRAFYADDALDDHVLLVVDVDSCEAAGSQVRWEAPEGTEDLFPHIYGPVPVPAVVAVLEITHRDDGLAIMPDLSDLDVVWRPPTSIPRDD